MRREEKSSTRYRAMFRGYPDALSQEQVRQMLGTGSRLAYRLLRTGAIPSVRMGRLYRVPKTAVIDYLYTNENTEQTCKNSGPR